MTEVEVEAQFKAFDAILKSNIAGVGMAQRLCDQSQLKKENDKLQVRNVRLFQHGATKKLKPISITQTKIQVKNSTSG